MQNLVRYVDFAASSYSKIFWLEALCRQGDSQAAYHVYGVFSYLKAPKFSRLKAALQMLVNNNYNLRSTFVMRDEILHQVICSNQDVELLSYIANDNQEFDTIFNQVINQPFDLEEGPLFRFVLISHLEIEQTIFLPIFHHIILDGTQFDNLMQQISDYYHRPIDLNIIDTKEISDLASYLAKEHEFYSHQGVEFWHKKLEKYPLTINFPTKSKVGKVDNQQVYQLSCLNANDYNDLKSFSSKYSFSVFHILKAAWALLISIYANQEKLLITFPVNLRGKNYRHLKGAFVNTPFYCFEKSGTFFDCLKNAQEDTKTNDHWLVNRIDIVSKLSEYDFSVSFSKTDLFIYGPNLESAAEAFTNHFVGGAGGAKLGFFYQEDSGKLNYGLIGSRQWVDETLLVQLQRHFETILAKLLASPDMPLNSFSCLNEHEYNQLAYIWSRDLPQSISKQTIHQLFEEQVIKTPDATALCGDFGKITYQRLNERANQLAHYLRKTYVIGADDLIATYVPRSEDLIIICLAILKSGAAYVPITPNHSASQISHILADSKAKVIITQDVLQNNCIKSINVMIWDSESTQKLLHTQSSNNLSANIADHHLAYVMYTSGTTGSAKGVMIEHRNVVSLIKNASYINLSDKYSIGLFADIGFDAATFEIYTALLNGGKLCIPHDTLQLFSQADHFKQYLIDNEINILWLSKILFEQVYTICADVFVQIEYLLVGGEILNYASVVKLLNSNIRPKYFLNAYGPTECTTFSLAYYADYYSLRDLQSVPIGRPVSGKSIYILDSELYPVPIGVVGELYIGGSGVARGYLNQEELTASRFIVNPFATASDIDSGNGRLYKSGDLARYLADGNIEYIGRNDFQVKIRGYRVELGEIESKLCRYRGVSQAVVVAYERAIVAGEVDHVGKVLVGYYVSSVALEAEELLSYLSLELPDYMVPSVLLRLERLPMTLNGKLDRKLLPRPELSGGGEYVAPANEIEAKISELYGELFGISVATIGRDANFFRLGGNSIVAIQVAHRLSLEFDVHLPVAEIFRSKTIEGLAKSIATTTNKNIVISVSPEMDEYPLSFAQERLLFIEKYEEGTSAYHMPRLTELREDMSISSLVRALESIVKRHEVLRTIYVQSRDGRYSQVVKDEGFAVIIRDCMNEEEYHSYLVPDVNKPFDLSNEYPIRACIYEVASTKKSYLLVNMHHIASDGWSIDVFQKELLSFYEHYHLSAEINLPSLKIQYKDFAIWQRNYLQGEEFARQLSYWRKRLSDYELLELATDKPRPSELSYAGKSFFFYLTPQLSLQLREFAKKYDYSLYTVLLSAFYLLMYHCSNQTDVMIGTPVANRHYESIKDLMGSFVNVVAQREQLNLQQSIIELMAQVHQHLIEVQNYQDIPFERLVQELNVIRDTRFHPLFQVMFSVQSFGLKEEKYGDYFQPLDINDIHPITRFDIGCFISTAKTEFKGLMSYSTLLFNDETIKLLLSSYIDILTQMVIDPEKLLIAYESLTKWEKPKSRSYDYMSLPLDEMVVAYVAPESQLEIQVCGIFAQLLGVPQNTISKHADFFRLGGNSVLSMQLAARLSQILGRRLPIIEIFRARTVAAIAEALVTMVKQSEADLDDCIVECRKGDDSPPLFIVTGGDGQ